MSQVPKNNQLTDLSSIKPKEIPISDVSIDRLLEDGLYILYREIKQLFILSSRGKLEPNDARDLRDHLKLLFELKERENDLLRNITDDELKAKAEKIIEDDKK